MQTGRSARRAISLPWLSLCVLLAIALAPRMAFAATRVITGADKGGEVRLNAGDTLEVRLKANPSTGFMWYIEKESTPLLKLTSQSQTEATEPGVGRSVFQIFRFEARRAGDGVLRLHYVRSWEKPTPDDEQFQIHVFIR